MSQACVRATALGGWDDVLRREGLETLSPTSSKMHCASSSSSIPLADFVRFSEQVVETTGNAAIPWLAGLCHELGSLGAVGEAMCRANRVGTAIRRFVDYFVLLQDCTEVRFDLDGDMASVSYRILDPDIWPRHNDAMFSLGIVAQVLMRGSKNACERVEFAFEAERSNLHGDVAKVLRTPCTFRAETNQIRFPAAMLDLELECSSHSTDIRSLNHELVKWRRTAPLIERLESIVYRDLSCQDIDQERVSRELGMSGRTMRRKLADEQSSFKDILDNCRLKRALFEFRTRPEDSIAEIALRLGYAEHSNFTRAFHRWVGISPQAYRNKNCGRSKH